MTDSAGPPQLGQIPQSSGFNVPTMSNINSVQDAKDTVYNSEVSGLKLSLSAEWSLTPYSTVA